jgi:cephalosporin hydroxylase/glycosyltransferase involved in cell wall biosynthesis
MQINQPGAGQPGQGDAPDAVTFPVKFLASAGVEGYLDAFGSDVIVGWITCLANPSVQMEIHVLEHGTHVATVTANRWRTDVQESRQGDGRWGFRTRPEGRLADGQDHLVTLATADGQDLLGGPLLVRFAPHTGDRVAADPADRTDPPKTARRRPPGAVRSLSPDKPLISFIVVFYNMAREAARTLASLRRDYQHGAEDIGYEVICIDNGSDPPLDPAFVAGFGPEFRLIRPERPGPSPVAAINAAARGARGHHLAVMIDGAHILSPGVLREAADAIAESPGAVVALRQWFVGGDQRFLSRSGWSQTREDMLFDRIAWPQDGYELFDISVPIWESPNHWFDGMSETNCLFLPAELFASIGGMDEAFDVAGAGYANLDLFRRAVAAAGEPMVALVGEASFHQFHGGTTTNVDDVEKDRRVRGYEFDYMRLRAQPWIPVAPADIRLRGGIRTPAALASRQRPLSPVRAGVTHEVRRAVLTTHFDEAATKYLVSTYAEAGLADKAEWRGQPLGVAPPDALAMAAILHQMRPSRVVAVNLPAGLLAFLREAMRGPEDFARFVVVGEGGIGGSGTTDPCDPGILRQVRRDVGPATETVVLYRPRPCDEMPLGALRAYAEFVSLRSYLVCIGTAWGQPWLGYSRRWTMSAITQFLDQAPFAVDTARTGHFITACPSGFLQRIGPVHMAGASDIGLVGVS